jgi:galactose mutarotase-like enzyme
MHRLEDTIIEGRPAVVLVDPQGTLRATVVPGLAMLCSSLTRDGHEFLGHPETVAAWADRGAATGIPLLHPWANRLGGLRIAGLDHDTVDPASPLVPLDGNGLPIHGLRTVNAGWRVTAKEANERRALVSARLDFPSDGELGALFPFPHAMDVEMALIADTLAVRCKLTATGAVAVPVSFGWHPYFRLPDASRSEWVVDLPVACHAVLDERGLPTGDERRIEIPMAPLGERTYDDLFPLHGERPDFRLGGGSWSVEVAFGDGYPVAQVYAPSNHDTIAFEPMTAPTNALVTGESLQWLAPGESYEAGFEVRVSAA